MATTHHNSEGGTSLGNYLVPLVGQVCNTDGTGALIGHLVVFERVTLVILVLW